MSVGWDSRFRVQELRPRVSDLGLAWPLPFAVSFGLLGRTVSLCATHLCLLVHKTVVNSKSPVQTLNTPTSNN